MATEHAHAACAHPYLLAWLGTHVFGNSAEQAGLQRFAAAQSGMLITASPAFNWTQQLNYMSYSVLVPNVVDLDNYRRTLSQLVNITKGLVTGQPPWTSQGAPCNRPIPALNG